MKRSISVVAACVGVTTARYAMAESTASSAFVSSSAMPADASISAHSVNGAPPVDSRTAVGPGTFVSVTAASTPGGSASASASAYSTTGLFAPDGLDFRIP